MRRPFRGLFEFAYRPVTLYNLHMHNFSLLVTDIDGTLTDPHGTLPATNLAALRRCTERGIGLALATGRNFTITRPLAETISQAVQQEIFLILQDGSLLLAYPSMTVLRYHNLPQAIAQTACNHFRACGQPVLLFDPLPDGNRFTLCEYGPLASSLQTYVGRKTGQFRHHPIDHPIRSGTSKIVTIDDLSRINTVYASLADCLPQARVLRTEAVHLDAWFLEVGPVQASKAQALASLVEHTGLDLTTVIAVGDAENDLEMIQAAGLGVAMGNASARVKAAADLVIDSNAVAGLGQFLERVLEGANYGPI